jgi:hypothetical protein
VTAGGGEFGAARQILVSCCVSSVGRVSGSRMIQPVTARIFGFGGGATAGRVVLLAR